MFDALTLEELDELSTRLNDADDFMKRHMAYDCCYRELRLETSVLEYDVWDARCRKAGKRCLRCQPTPDALAAAA